VQHLWVLIMHTMICPNCGSNMIRTDTGSKKREEHYDSTIYLHAWRCACGNEQPGRWNVLKAKQWSVSRWLDVNEAKVKALVFAESPAMGQSHQAQD